MGERRPASAVGIRLATDADAPALASLLAHLGYPADAAELPDRLRRLRSAGDDAFVAEVDGATVGLATVHSRAVLHAARPVVQLTALVVPPEMRGRGVGRALVDEAERWGKARGADRLVVTTALHREDAPLFYERIGFEHTGRRYVKRLVLLALAMLTLMPSPVRAQVREYPVPFDSAGRVLSITPPLAVRLGLGAPAWPVTGDYLDARLYTHDDSARSSVLVVRRQREVLDRYSLSMTQRADLSAAVNRGIAAQLAAGGPDSLATRISEPVRGWFVANQTILGVALFGPSAAALAGNAAGGTAAYLAVAGGTFFLAADRARRTSISGAVNHLAWHGALHGAIAAGLATYSIGGDDVETEAMAGALLAGGVIGDVVGYHLARPMTDAEAHGVSHGAFATSGVGLGSVVASGMWREESSRRVATSLVVGAGAIGYPLGLRYARRTSYRVTSGDVGTLIVGELLGTSAAATFIPKSGDDEQVVAGLLTAGFVAGAIGADRLFVRPFDYDDAESRLLQFGTVAGAVVGLAVPVLARADNPALIFGPATVGGVVGAIVTHNLISPAHANSRFSRRTGARPMPSRFTMRFTPQNLVLAGTRREGVYPVLNVAF